MTQWSFAPLVAIAIFLAFMFFGYFFGLAEGNSKGYKKRQKEEAEEKRQRPIEPVPPASPPRPADEAPLLDVSMTTGGELHLKLDGQHMDASTLDANQRKRLIAILTQIRPWLEAPKPQPAASHATPSAQPHPATPAAPRPAPAATPNLASRPVPTPAPKATMPALDGEDETPAAPQSIVAQINSILQARLAGTPLADQGIRLQESLEGGVLVWVGINKFEGVEEVPDEQIKTALRTAISEWEKKYTPGL